MTRNSLGTALLVLVALTGCGARDSGPPVYPVRGIVTLDGEPIPSATILLKDPTGQYRTCVATVKDGVITGESTAGEKTLEITAIRVVAGQTVPGADGSGREAATEQYLPEKYNRNSTLTAQIETSGPTTLTLDLSSKD